MKVIDNEIGEEGLARQLVDEGLGDIKVKIGSEEVVSVKSILIKGNRTFKKLINENKSNEVLELSEICDVETFLLIEKFYSGGYIDINTQNIFKILSMCISYKDLKILELCKRYLKNHLNEEIMMKLFEIKHSIDKNNMLNLKEICKEYIKENGYIFIKKNELLFKLLLEDIEFILDIYRIPLKDETYLTTRLIEWFNNNNNNKEIEEEFENFMLNRINFYGVDWNIFPELLLDELTEINISLNIDENKNNNNNNNYYIGLIKDKNSIDDNVDDKYIKEIINKYYNYNNNSELIALEEDEINNLQNMNIKNSIDLLLINDDVKLNEIGIIMIIDTKLNMKIYHSIKIKLINKLIKEYRNNDNNNNKLVIIKCLSLFINNSYLINIIDSLNGRNMLIEMLNNKNIISKENRKYLKHYFKKYKYNNKKEEKKVTYFFYPKNKYCFIPKQLFSIKPICDGTNCKFSIVPNGNNKNKNSNISINKNTGVIKGYINKEIEKKEYVVHCIDENNKNNEMKFVLNIETKEIKFIKKNKCKNIKINAKGNVITNISNYWNHCWLNIKLENGIYRIKFKFHLMNNTEKDGVMLGLSNENDYNGKNIFNNENTCCYYAWNGQSRSILNHIGKTVNENPNIYNHGDGSVYEMIVNMKSGEYFIKHNEEDEILLVNELKCPLYVFVCISGSSNKMELLDISNEDM